MRKRTKIWKKERERDPYHRMAKQEGYRSRSAYKLVEASGKKPLIRPGYKVLDLGAAPGGWLQVTSRKMGNRGLIIGVDKEPIAPFKTKNIKLLMIDVNNPQLPEIVLNIAKGKLHTVLSDLSPNISGAWETDSAVQIGLAETAFRIAHTTLRPRGCFLVKLFQSPQVREYYQSIKKNFNRVSYFKPKSSKPSSPEIYLTADGFKG